MAIMIGDILNTINIHRRPFEVIPGSVDETMKQAREVIDEGISSGNWLNSLFKARKIINSVKLKKEKRPVVL